MARLYVMVVLAAILLMVHVALARNIPTKNPDEIPQGLTENTVHVATAAAPTGAGVKDKKNFITYGGVGGWAGVGYAGVIPTLGGIGGVGGGVGGVGGVGGLGGIGGLGGVGGVGGLGGAGGLGGLGVGGGIGGGKIIP